MKPAVLLAALALAACGGGDPADGLDVPAPEADVVPAAPPPTPAKLLPPPGPAAGKWRINLSVQGNSDARRGATPPQDTCLLSGLTLEEAQMQQADTDLDCTDYEFTQEGASVIGRYTCTYADGSKMTSEVTTTGDMSRAYTSTIVNTHVNPPPGLPGGATLILVAERIGECSGQPPPPLFPDPPAEPPAQ